MSALGHVEPALWVQTLCKLLTITASQLAVVFPMEAQRNHSQFRADSSIPILESIRNTLPRLKYNTASTMMGYFPGRGGQIDPPLALAFDTAGGRQKLQCSNTQGIFPWIESTKKKGLSAFRH